MKLWQKNNSEIHNAMLAFTMGKDLLMDKELILFDILGSIAHITMLNSIHFLTTNEFNLLKKELIILYKQNNENPKLIPPQHEDVHSFIEFELTQKLGEIGKKIHTARSRNDQVFVDIKLYLRNEILLLSNKIKEFFILLQSKSEEHKDDLLPGYTHFQLAMPASFGLWFGAYSECLIDDLVGLKTAFTCCNKNPLGTAAGFGSSIPIDRVLTTQLLGFDRPDINSLYVQISRGKFERTVASAIVGIAETLSKFAFDVCLFLSQNFAFLNLAPEFATGSSIMPHKKNPDVFELIRAKCNKLKALPIELSIISSNLLSGYHRDFQILKESLFPSFKEINDCLDMIFQATNYLLINKKILDSPKYDCLFSVENVNELVNKGVPFRTAYQTIANDIDNNQFIPIKQIKHSHLGSINNLGNELLVQEFTTIFNSFPRKHIDICLQNLLEL